METPVWSRRKFLGRSFAFSAAGLLAGCRGPHPLGLSDAVASDGLHVLAVGDWGQYGIGGDYRAQASVAAAMRTYVQRHNLETSALLMLGDNFYGPLAEGVQSPRWQSQFESMYPASSFGCPAYAVPGNHDYQRDPAGLSKFEAELVYGQRDGGTRWTMPGLPYRFSLPAQNPVITFVAFDSNMPNEPAQPIPRPGTGYYTMTDAQRQTQVTRLTQMLAAPAPTPFLAVMGHHPVYSDGPHGDNNTLIRDIDPLLRQHRVHLYMAGHDHDLQHIEMPDHPTSFLLSGGGGADLYEIGEKKHQGYADKVHGFSHLQVKPDMMIVRHVNEHGAVIHSFTKTPDGMVTTAT